MLTRRMSHDLEEPQLTKKLKKNGTQQQEVNEEVPKPQKNKFIKKTMEHRVLRKESKQNEEIDETIEEQEEIESNIKQYIKNKATRMILKKKGFTRLFPIQEKCYTPIYNGEDLVGQDRTGSGKTLAYCLPIIEKQREKGYFNTIVRGQAPYVLIVVPTRELALQVANELKNIKHKEDEFRIATVLGGFDLRQSISDLQKGTEWVVGTPGRLLDMLTRGVIKLNKLETIILDEADQMLSLGFQEDIEKVFEFIKTQKSEEIIQCLLFSATVPAWVKSLSQKYMRKERVFINLIQKLENQTATSVTHYALNCAFGMSVGTIGDIVTVYGGRHCRTIIFCETKQQANDIMLKANLPMEMSVLHGDIPQNQRVITFEGFKQGKFKCLVATNVASRGLDFPQVDLIVQLDPPKDTDTYIHRSGRTGRAGKPGVCITFFTKKQTAYIARIEKQANIKFIKISAPQPDELIKASCRDLAVSLKDVNKEIVQLFLQPAEDVAEQLGPIEALARALACISGYKDKLKQRSMLGSFEGYVTYVMKCVSQFRNFGYIWSILKRYFPVEMVQSIKGMKKMKNDNGVVFDMAEIHREEFDRINQIIQETNPGFSIEVATVLPEYEEQQFQVQQKREQEIPKSIMQRKKDLEVFIGGLDFGVEEWDVEGYFKKNGVEFYQIRMLRDEQNNSKGIAFGFCKDEKMVQTALSLNGSIFKRRPIRVNMAQSKPKK